MQWGEPWATKREKYRLMADDAWREWFAWYPVTLEDGTKAWRERVEYNQPMKYNLPTYRAVRSSSKRSEDV